MLSGEECRREYRLMHRIFRLACARYVARCTVRARYWKLSIISRSYRSERRRALWEDVRVV